MAVAPSFQNFEMLCEPFAANGKMYIRVRNPKTGTERQVRWYEEKSTKTISSNEPVITRPVSEKPQKEVLGFAKGYITIFKGDTYKHLDWFRMSIARYARYFGWYIVSTDEIPADLPADLEPIQLPWERVGSEDGYLIPEDQIKVVVESLIYDESPSTFQGKIGERIEIDAIITKVIALEGEFSSSNMHIMEDPCGNVYVWTTASKNWSVGSHKIVRGTVKDHRIYKNIRQTILNRCMEVSKR